MLSVANILIVTLRLMHDIEENFTFRQLSVKLSKAKVVKFVGKQIHSQANSQDLLALQHNHLNGKKVCSSFYWVQRVQGSFLTRAGSNRKPTQLRTIIPGNILVSFYRACMYIQANQRLSLGSKFQADLRHNLVKRRVCLPWILFKTFQKYCMQNFIGQASRTWENYGNITVYLTISQSFLENQ